MLDTINGLFNEIWMLLLAMSPYLLFGFTFAGILKVLIPEEVLLRHMSGRRWSSVFKAALLGVPLPLCSCGVIPVTAHLRKAGAGKGAMISFLTSTPTTGIDSIFATYSLLGGVFTFFRIIASFFIGIIGGILVNIFVKDEAAEIKETKQECCCSCDGKECGEHHSVGLLGKIYHMLRYAYVELIDDVGRWLIIGIVAGGCISYFVPAHLVENYMGSPLVSYTIMLLIGVPMYVCATGSIPIAASLILKGMSPGAGLVFLIVGPAVNTASLSFVGGKLGARTLFIYLASLMLGSVCFGLIVDSAWPGLGHQIRSATESMHMLPYWLEMASAVVLVAFISRSYLLRLKKRMKKA